MLSRYTRGHLLYTHHCRHSAIRLVWCASRKICTDFSEKIIWAQKWWSPSRCRVAASAASPSCSMSPREDAAPRHERHVSAWWRLRAFTRVVYDTCDASYDDVAAHLYGAHATPAYDGARRLCASAWRCYPPPALLKTCASRDATWRLFNIIQAHSRSLKRPAHWSSTLRFRPRPRSLLIKLFFFVINWRSFSSALPQFIWSACSSFTRLFQMPSSSRFYRHRFTADVGERFLGYWRSVTNVVAPHQNIVGNIAIRFWPFRFQFACSSPRLRTPRWMLNRLCGIANLFTDDAITVNNGMAIGSWISHGKYQTMDTVYVTNNAIGFFICFTPGCIGHDISPKECRMQRPSYRKITLPEWNVPRWWNSPGSHAQNKMANVTWA